MCVDEHCALRRNHTAVCVPRQQGRRLRRTRTCPRPAFRTGRKKPRSTRRAGRSCMCLPKRPVQRPEASALLAGGTPRSPAAVLRACMHACMHLASLHPSRAFQPYPATVPGTSPSRIGMLPRPVSAHPAPAGDGPACQHSTAGPTQHHHKPRRRRPWRQAVTRPHAHARTCRPASLRSQYPAK